MKFININIFGVIAVKAGLEGPFAPRHTPARRRTHITLRCVGYLIGSNESVVLTNFIVPVNQLLPFNRIGSLSPGHVVSKSKSESICSFF